MAPSRESPVFQLVRANDEKHEKGHTRLREDLTAVEDRLLIAETALKEQAFTLKMLQASPQDISKLSVTPGIVVGIILTVGSIIAGQLGSTWGIRSDIRDISTRLDAQRNATEAIGKKQELLQLKFEELRDQVLGRRSR